MQDLFYAHLRAEVRVYMKRLFVATFLPVLSGSFNFLNMFVGKNYHATCQLSLLT